jgi:AAA domain
MIPAARQPPGTGKTTVIVEIIRAAKRALVLAPSNAAVANVALRLIRKEQFGRNNIVVWGDNCDDSVSFLNPKRRYADYKNFFRRYTAEEDDKKRQKELGKFVSWLAPDATSLEEFSVEAVEALCLDATGHASIAAANVVLCTLNTAGSRSLRKAVMASKKKFELCVLDEASQCTEAEFYIGERLLIVESGLCSCGLLLTRTLFTIHREFQTRITSHHFPWRQACHCCGRSSAAWSHGCESNLRRVRLR